MTPPKPGRGNPLRMDIGALAVNLAAENVCSAKDAMELDFGEALIWNARIVKRYESLKRAK